MNWKVKKLYFSFYAALHKRDRLISNLTFGRYFVHSKTFFAIFSACTFTKFSFIFIAFLSKNYSVQVRKIHTCTKITLFVTLLHILHDSNLHCVHKAKYNFIMFVWLSANNICLLAPFSNITIYVLLILLQEKVKVRTFLYL